MLFVGVSQLSPSSGAVGAEVAVSCIPVCGKVPLTWGKAVLGTDGNSPSSEMAQAVPVPSNTPCPCLIDHNKHNQRSSTDLFKSFR